MTRQQVYEFFANFGIVPGVKYKPISHDRLTCIVRAARSWHGMAFAKFVFDCFVPVVNVFDGAPKEWMPDMPLEEEEIEIHEEGR